MTNSAILIPSHSFITKAFIFLIAYFTPIAEMVHVMMFFILLDTISGIWASVKIECDKDKETYKDSKCKPPSWFSKVESHKLRKTVYKFVWYTIAVMTSLMMEKTFHLAWTSLSSIVGGFICFVELKSIFENITVITNDPIFMRILKVIQKKGSETIQEIGDDDKNIGENTNGTGK